MTREELEVWVDRLNPRLRLIKGFGNLEVGKGKAGNPLLWINLEHSTAIIQEKIMSALESAGADEVPYKTRVVGRVVKLKTA